MSKWLLMLMHSIHLAPRKLSIIIAGESVNDRDGIRGGDSPLSEQGRQYALAVAALLERRRAEADRPPPRVMTGTLKRYRETVALLRGRDDTPAGQVLPFRALDELCFGALEGLRAGLLRDSFPDEFAAREQDKLNYRYPGVGKAL